MNSTKCPSRQRRDLLLSSVDYLHIEYTDYFSIKLLTNYVSPVFMAHDWWMRLNIYWNNFLKCMTGNAYLLKMIRLIWSIFCKLIEKIDSGCSLGNIFREITVGHKAHVEETYCGVSPGITSFFSWMAGPLTVTSFCLQTAFQEPPFWSLSCHFCQSLLP